MIASKHFDPVLGIDIHIVLIPTPGGPVPTPIPHPFIGMVIDPLDYAPIIGATVYVNGLPRGVAGSAGKNVPPHIPIGGPFQKPPGNECENFMGSSTVLAEDEPLSYLGLPVLSCQDIGMPPPPRPKKKGTKVRSLVLPTSTLLAVPMGPPVLVGGAPTISLMALGMRAGMAALGGAFRKLKKAKKGKAKKVKGKKGRSGEAASNKGSCKAGCPVDAITGSVQEAFTDVDLAGPVPFRWRRWYDSGRVGERSDLGRGWRHSLRTTLERVPDGFVLRAGDGDVFELPPLDPETGRSVSGGYELTRAERGALRLARRGEPTFEFVPTGHGGPLRPVRLLEGAHAANVRWDREGTLRAIDFERGPRIRVDSDDAGRITRLVLEEGQKATTLVRYEYGAAGGQVGSSDVHGAQTRYDYDDAGRLVRMTDPRGYAILYAYDERGRCSRTWGEDGLYDESFEYYPELNESVRRSASGATWTYVYDDAGTLVQLVDPYGGIRTFVKDDTGRVVEDVDPNGLVTELLYDGRGEHTGRRTPLGVVNPPAHVDNDPPDPLPLRLPETPVEWSWGGMLRPGHVREPRRAVAAEAGTPEGAGPGADGEPPDGTGGAPPGSVLPGPGEFRDATGLVLERTDHAGRTHRWTYDAAGNPVAFRDADGATTRRDYFSWNLVRRETSPAGDPVTYDYNIHEEVTRVVDGGGTVSEYDYDLKDQLVEVRRDGRVRERYVYDAAGNLVEKRDGRDEPLLTLEVGPQGLPIKRELASGEKQEFEYDELGHFTRVASQTGETVFERDGADRVLADLRDGEGVRHGLAWGRPAETVLFDRFRTELDFDFSGHAVLVDPTGLRHDLTVDRRRGEVRRSLPGGGSETSRFDRAGLLVERRRSSADGSTTRSAYRYSREGDLLERIDGDGRTIFRYDESHRLVAEQTPGGEPRRYHFDRAGNLRWRAGIGALEVGAGNRLARAGDATFEWDERDRIAVRREGGRETRYRYDSRDMLVAAEVDGRTWTAEYDPLGRRIRKTWDGRTTEYHWDDKRVAAETRPDGSFRMYVYPDVESLVPLLFVDYDSRDDDPEDGRVYVLFTDQRGCPERVVDTGGATVWKAEIDPYGVAEVDPSSSIALDLRMPGHWFDPETGLHYNRFRYYDPRLGRYLQSDPLGQAGGVNLFSYLPNPLTQVDIVGWGHANDLSGAKGKTNKAAGADVETPKARRGDAEATEAVAAKGGMDPGHLKNLQKHCAENNRVVVMRAGNEASVPHIRDPAGAPKPVDCKLNTAKTGKNKGKVTTGQSKTEAGVSKWKPKEEGGKGYKKNYDELKKDGWTTEDGVLKDPEGKYVHGDYDMQGVYDKNPDGSYGPPKKADGSTYPKGTNEPEFQRDMNDALNDPENYDGPDKDMVQHGANDDFKDPNDKTKPGRTPEPDEDYVVVDENGDAQIIEGTDNLKDYYEAKGIEPWPY